MNSKLINDLEEADRGDPDLDRRVHEAIGSQDGEYLVAPVTTSLDAAMKLIPYGTWVNLNNEVSGRWVFLSKDAFLSWGRGHSAALAVCAAVVTGLLNQRALTRGEALARQPQETAPEEEG